ncbi:bacillithiol biosynthesis deacetylase BshB1 [Stella humosa]|uniref:Bacillithiol biosynthesis deacetylase BshB1 n=1 Tax=Stella humosa TaxID=94 RepID=A0A3N1MDU9_9PROT|nr:bacillithiol biosynthesis deacetylase BshB1 [Stella humosa]ROQ01728.1 bacillithiol biosynthesis deacetylase BshB1 [Stella humosa]BBK32110.1 bacillithiol biosynthesis deacetylase BshB1 [Stella humosa]
MTPVDILAISTHPDDVELACGGTLILAVRQGLRVGLADLSAGEAATRGTPALRREEAAEAARRLGVAWRCCLDLPDGRIGDTPEQVEPVIALLRQARPRILLLPYPQDRHPDHAAAARLVERAAFLARLKGHGAGAPHAVNRLLHYCGHHPFQPAIVIDVSTVWEERMAALLAHASQFESGTGSPTALSDGSFLRFVEARAVCHGAMIGVAHGEGFAMSGPVGLSGIDLLLPPAGPRAYRNFA